MCKKCDDFDATQYPFKVCCDKKIIYVGTTTENNKPKFINFGTAYNQGGGQFSVANKINTLPNTILPTDPNYKRNEVDTDEVAYFIGVIFPADRSAKSYRVTYVAEGKNAGRYGQGGNITLQDSDLRVIDSVQLTFDITFPIIANDPNSHVEDLGEIADGNFQNTINSKTLPYFTIQGETNWYFKFTQNGSEVLVGFTGADGTYGQGQSQVQTTDFFYVYDQRTYNDGVDSVTGVGVDNSDPKNPVINVDLSAYQPLVQKNQVNGYAGIGADGKIPTNLIPNIAITDKVTATETTLTAFLPNNANYTYEKGDVVLINHPTEETKHYLYWGGDKSLEASYSLIETKKVDWSDITNKPERYNVIIRGVATLFPDKTSFAQAIETLESAPYDTVDVSSYFIQGSDVFAYVEKPYRLVTDKMKHQPSTGTDNELVTEYNDIGGMCRYIGNGVFSQSTNLKTINFRGVVELGSYVFNVSGITDDVFMPELLKSGLGAFSGVPATRISCPNLTVIPNYFMGGACAVKHILESDFQGCVEVVGTPFPTGIESANLPNVITFGDSTFKQRASMTSLIAPNLKYMGQQVFWLSGMTAVELPELEVVTNSLYTFGRISNAKLPKLKVLGTDTTSNNAWYIASTIQATIEVHKTLKFAQGGQPHKSLQVLGGSSTITYKDLESKPDLAYEGLSFLDDGGVKIGSTLKSLRLENLEYNDSTKTLKAKQLSNFDIVSTYTHDETIRGLQMNNQGTRVFWSGVTKTHSAELTKPFDLSSMTNIKTQAQAGNCVRVSADGTRMIKIFQTGGVGHTHYKDYTLSTPYDVSTAVEVSSRSISSFGSIQPSWYGFEMSPDGMTLYTSTFNANSDKFLKLQLVAPYTLTGYTLSETALQTTPQGFGLASMTFGKGGHELYASWIVNSGNTLYKYYLDEAYNLDGITQQLGYSNDLPVDIKWGIGASQVYEYMIYVVPNTYTINLVKINNKH